MQITGSLDFTEEDQCAVFLNKGGAAGGLIDWILRRNIARCIVCIKAGILAVGAVSAPCGTVSACERRAAGEHPVASQDTAGAPFSTAENGFQLAALTEHIGHVFDICSVEADEIQLFQAAAICKHLIHAFNGRGIEIPKHLIELLQVFAVLEHAVHVCDIGCIRIIHNQLSDMRSGKHARHIPDMGKVGAGQFNAGCMEIPEQIGAVLRQNAAF